ncbi:PREDICTED: uncharacterized protein LOC102018675, partial [Chinchilla lanigera]|uniref:uncharacterized protein LOC102018675 n=1 Tax=Chinchilla lanigera TaxID=34839 RepID=UPI00069726F7
LTFGSFVPVLSDHDQFSSVYQMSPKDTSLGLGMVSLMLHFSWTWVGLVIAESQKGLQFLSDLKEEMDRNGICVAFEKMISSTAMLHFLNRPTHDLWTRETSPANVVIMYFDPSESDAGFYTGQHLVTWRVWVTNSQWHAATFGTNLIIDSFHGTIIFSNQREEISGFKTFIQTASPSKFPEDIYFTVFWAMIFDCTLSNFDCTLKNCPPNASLTCLPLSLFDPTMSEESYNMYNAVYAVAHALQETLLQHIQMQPSKNGEWKGFSPWQLHRSLKELQFTNPAGDQVNMDEQRKPAAEYDILNFWNVPEGLRLRTKVGRFSPHAPHGQQLSLNEDVMEWGTGITEEVKAQDVTNTYLIFLRLPAQSAVRAVIPDSGNPRGRDWLSAVSLAPPAQRMRSPTRRTVLKTSWPFFSAKVQMQTWALAAHKAHVQQCMAWKPAFSDHCPAEAGGSHVGDQHGFKVKNYQYVLALVFAIEEINSNPHLLPNISLGYEFHNVGHSQWRTLESSLSLLTGQDEIPNYTCGRGSKSTAVLTGTAWETSAQVGTLLELYRFPQLTFGSFVPMLSDQDQFPSVYQMSPKDTSLALGMVSLMLHFSWTWVGLVIAESQKGLQFLSDLKEEMDRNGICVAFEKMISSTAMLHFSDRPTHDLWTRETSPANVVIMYFDPSESDAGFYTEQHLVTWRVWVTNSQWHAATFGTNLIIDSFHGTIIFSNQREEISGFKTFIQTASPSKFPEDIYFTVFWAMIFDCTLSNFDCTLKNCPPNASLTCLPLSLFDPTMSEESYNMYNAVYAVAHALQETLLQHIQMQPSKNGEWKGFSPWQLHRSLKELQFTNPAGDQVNMDEQRKPAAEFKVKNYQYVLALVFAIEEINSNHHLLPNISLGYELHNVGHSQWRTLESSLALLTGQDEIPNYTCGRGSKSTAVLTGTAWETSAQVGTLLELYRFPQLTFGSFVPVLSDHDQFSSVYQMSPKDTSLGLGMVSLMLHFSWTWVGLVIAESQKGLQFLSDLKEEMDRNGICVAFEKMISSTAMLHFLNRPTHDLWTRETSPANVVIMYFDPSESDAGFYTGQHLVTWRVWVTNSQWHAATFGKNLIIDSFHGTIIFSNQREEISGFKTFIQTASPSKFPEDIYFTMFWAINFDCTLSNFDCTLKNCPPNASLTCLPLSLFDPTMNEESYSIYNAVYAVAHALHETLLQHVQMQPSKNGEQKGFSPWQLHRSLKELQFTNPAGDQVNMDEQRKPAAEYDILNFWNVPEGLRLRTKVGRFSPHAPHGQQLSLNEDVMEWGTGITEVIWTPRSVCSESCNPGFRKSPREGLAVCCFSCTPCPENEISNETDKEQCLRCPDHQYANAHRNCCLPKAVTFLAYEDPLGKALAGTALSLTVLTAAVLGLFVKHRHTPIVKANNRALSYILLVSLTCCFLCALLFIGRPRTTTCILQQTSFAVVFTVAVSSVLAKTITVVLAFKVTAPGRRMRQLLVSGAPNSIIPICSLIQLTLCGVWMGTNPPYIDTDAHSEHGHILIVCNKGSLTAFYCVLGYLGSLTLASFTVAFLARNLPDTFNEAKFLTFSMLVFCSVWVTFLPVYHSTKGKVMVAMEVFSILASGAGLLGCIFAPKCYIILIRSDKNSLPGFRDKTHSDRKKPF